MASFYSELISKTRVTRKGTTRVLIEYTEAECLLGEPTEVVSLNDA